MEIDREREKAGKGFVANNRLISRYVSVADGFKIIQIVEIENPSILGEWVEAYRNAVLASYL